MACSKTRVKNNTKDDSYGKQMHHYVFLHYDIERNE
uniref:Uncharacterized protein n=1 Tax=Anguilla anguilla TaxID=7936 RepID=A0A0E9XPY0_ANGAN